MVIPLPAVISSNAPTEADVRQIIVPEFVVSQEAVASQAIAFSVSSSLIAACTVVAAILPAGVFATCPPVIPVREAPEPDGAR